MYERNQRTREDGTEVWWPAVPRVLVWLSHALDQWPRAHLWALCWVLLAAAFTSDVATGGELGWSLFYLLPVTAAAWHLGWRPALLLVVAGAGAWLLAERASAGAGFLTAVQAWNALVQATFFIIVAYALTLLRHALRYERELARTDWLTGLPNTRSFLESAAHEVARSRRSGTPLTLAYIDLDGFKQVNDTLGHAAGDELLRRVAAELRARVRDVDIVARVGGDEFAVLFPDTSEEQASIALERLHAAVAVVAARGGWPVRFSAGAVTCTHPLDPDDLIRAADRAMYEAKRRGGDGSFQLVLSEAGGALR